MSGIAVSDSTLVHTITEFVRDTETELLFNHSSRVFFFGAIAGQQRGLTLNPELLYVATMSHRRWRPPFAPSRSIIVAGASRTSPSKATRWPIWPMTRKG